MTGAVIVSGLTKTYPGAREPALAGLDFSIAGGAALGLLGPNGAGKTTAISIVCTLLKPDGGSVTVDGHDALRHPGRARRRLGLVPQEIALYPTLTGRENLRYFGRIYGLTGKELRLRVDEGLALMGLTEHADKRVDHYSGGMARRANLAVGILHRPAVLVLDEPTVGIDAQSRGMILDNLARLREGGMTLIYTTHYMEEAQRLCTDLVIVDRGRAIATGTPQDLVAAAEGCDNLEELFLHLTGRQLRDA